MNKVRAEAEKIDPMKCEISYQTCEVMNPYGIFGEHYQVSRDMFVRNVGSDFWVHVSDLAPECREAIEIRKVEETFRSSALVNETW